MKKILITLNISLICFLFSIGQNNTIGKNNEILAPPKVDKRVELLSIVFRLAGNEEYNWNDYQSYVKDIHDHFDKYKKHPVVKLAKYLRKKNGVSYDAVMSMAIHLEQPSSLKPLIPFNDSIPESRWGSKNSYKFVQLLQQFYVDAKCEEFFKAHESLYLKAEERYKVIYDSIDVNWYTNFFGKGPNENFHIILGLGNGPSSYGPNINFPDIKDDVYAIIGIWDIDSLGIPIADYKNEVPLLVHEFNHSFVNQLIDQNIKQFEPAGKILFKEVESLMREQKYTRWESMMYESLVRASTIMYLKKHEISKNYTERIIVWELSNGFLWIRELVESLDKYEMERNNYPTLESFMPQIITCFQTSADNIKTLKANYELQVPHVASIQQFENNAKNVDPNITEIKVYFDKPMKGKGYCINYGDKGKSAYPITEVIGYSDDNKAITFKVKLKPNKEYQFILSGYGFFSKDAYSLEEYKVNFKTRK